MDGKFARRLTELRKKNKKTQAQMAEILNVQRTTICGYELGNIIPPYDKIQKIAQYFDVTIDYLMGNTNNPKRVESAATPAVNDVSVTLNSLLNDLKNKDVPLNIDGYQLDDESRELLIASIENSVKMGKFISAQKKKG